MFEGKLSAAVLSWRRVGGSSKKPLQWTIKESSHFPGEDSAGIAKSC